MPEERKNRNVFVYDCGGHIISGFWHGDDIYEDTGKFLPGDGVPNDSTEIVPERKYVLLTLDGMPLKVVTTARAKPLTRSLEPLVALSIFNKLNSKTSRRPARPRNPSVQVVESRRLFYRERTRERDPYCLITKLLHEGKFERFDAAHIFPRAHQKEWVDRHFPSKITDPAPDNQVGGSSKIDSVQNVILLRKDLHSAWDNYCFGVNPDRNYVIIPFTKGYDDIAGKTLNLDHIQDPDLRPLDDLFRDHFLQGIFKNMKGAGEPSWDHENTSGPEGFDLSQMDIWGTAEGRDQLELTLADRLHSTIVEQRLI